MVLLDIAPEKVAAYIAAGATAVAGIAKAFGALRDLRRRREYEREAVAAERDAAARVAPFGQAADPAQAALELRARIAEMDADRSRLAWKLEEARRQRILIARDNERLQDALTSERRMREMVDITCGHLRRRVADLEYQLGDALVQPDEDAPSWIVDESDRIVTPVLPPKLVKS